MNERIYSILLSLYPAELREDFGAEMTQVFLDDLEDATRTRGFFGAARVWRSSLKELLKIAVPARVAGREIAVPLIMYVLQEIYLGGIILLMGKKSPDMPKSFGEGVAVMMMGLIPAITAFVALHIGNRSVPEPLNLSSK